MNVGVCVCVGVLVGVGDAGGISQVHGCPSQTGVQPGWKLWNGFGAACKKLNADVVVLNS